MLIEKGCLAEYGAQRFLNSPIQQNWHALFCLEHFLEDLNPNVIIELGTGSGALATFFSYHAQTWSFDNQDRRTLKGRYNFVLLDVFTEAAYKMVRHLTTPTPTFFFFDNGDKPRELEIYASLVKHGDHVMIHDYGHAITDKHIPPGFEKYRQPELDDMETKLLCLRRTP